MLSDAAMLHWLDGFSNNAMSSNENLSREFMELFALGHGNGYSEMDVREGARALTGWGIGPSGKAEVESNQHDSNVKTVLGVTGNLDHTAFCDAVLGQPQSAPFVAGKLWRELASDKSPSPAALGRLVDAYGPGRDLKALTKAILLDPEFTTSTGTIVTAPIEWMVGVIRALKVPIDENALLDSIRLALAVMNQRPFYPPNVNGWPHGQAWLSTTSTVARLWAADKFVTLGDLSTVEDAAKGDRIEATGYLIGVGVWTDRTVAALKGLVDDPKRIVAAAVNAPEYLTA